MNSISHTRSRAVVASGLLVSVACVVALFVLKRGSEAPAPELPRGRPDAVRTAAAAPAPHASTSASGRTAGEEPGAAEESGASAEEGPLAEAERELASQVDRSLDGELYVNELLDQVLRYAELPISERVDFDYEEHDEIPYRLLGTPDGTDAHFLVGMQPFERDGEEWRYVQLEIQLGSGEFEYERGAMREGPRVHLSLDYNADGPGSLSLMTERYVAPHESRQEGIDAYSGVFTSGARFSVNLASPSDARAETYGLVDGNYTLAGEEFPGARPLYGDLDVDVERVRALHARLLELLEYAKSGRSD